VSGIGLSRPLDVLERVQQKLGVAIYSCLHGQAPRYLTDHCTPVFDVSARQYLRPLGVFGGPSMLAQHTRFTGLHGWRRSSVVRASVSDWRTFHDMRLIYGWRVTTSWVRRPLWVNQPDQLSLLPSVGRGMSSISVARWVTLLAAVSPSSECLYEEKADVVYLQVTVVIHIRALYGRVIDDRRYTSPLPFLSFLCGRPVALEFSTRQLERSGSWQGQLRTPAEDAFIYIVLKHLAY